MGDTVMNQLRDNYVNQGSAYNDKEEMQYVAFKLGNEEYAADILAVQEIIRWTDITRVPRAPSFVKGVINLRGNVIPVIDSHQRFNLSESGVSESTRIIVFRIDESPIGMTVDMVTEVIRLTQSNMEKSYGVNGVDNQFISGIGKQDNRLLIIMDLRKVLDLGLQQSKE